METRRAKTAQRAWGEACQSGFFSASEKKIARPLHLWFFSAILNPPQGERQ